MTDAAELARLAQLARLELSDDERARLGDELERILRYVGQLERLDVDDVPPTKHVIDLVDVQRDDVETPSLPREQALAGAPETEDGSFVVPLVVSRDGDE